MNERDDMQLKRDLDALPRAIEPPVDLWPDVRSRLKKRGIGGSGDRGIEGSEDRGIGPAVPRSRGPAIRIAALLAILAVSAGALAITRRGAATWTLAHADGTTRPLQVGEAIGTAENLRVTVGRIGHLDISPGTSMRLVAASMTEQRMALGRGTIHAEISAPPRLFVVETPSGTAVDLGCAYTLTVDSSGSSTLVVTAGWVSFEDGAGHSLIPAGMRAVARKGAGIGTPVMDDAPAALQGAVTSFDASPSDSAIGAVLRSARTRDAVTLWHLVQKTTAGRRERVLTKLIAMVPLPDGVTRAAIERAEPHAMELYWIKLPGTLPIIPSWQQALWKFWLKVAG